MGALYVASESMSPKSLKALLEALPGDSRSWCLIGRLRFKFRVSERVNTGFNNRVKNRDKTRVRGWS